MVIKRGANGSPKLTVKVSGGGLGLKPRMTLETEFLAPKDLV